LKYIILPFIIFIYITSCGGDIESTTDSRAEVASDKLNIYDTSENSNTTKYIDTIDGAIEF